MANSSFLKATIIQTNPPTSLSGSGSENHSSNIDGLKSLETCGDNGILTKTSLTRGINNIMNNKFFQLEEKEHSESCISEVYLSSDGNLSITNTDGPPHQASMGFWQIIVPSSSEGERECGDSTINVVHGDDNNNIFEMNIVREFMGGREGTDMGEFDFKVERRYRGTISQLGDTIIVDGSIMFGDDLIFGDENAQVGFFSMIETANMKHDENPIISPISHPIEDFSQHHHTIKEERDEEKDIIQPHHQVRVQEDIRKKKDLSTLNETNSILSPTSFVVMNKQKESYEKKDEKINMKRSFTTITTSKIFVNSEEASIIEDEYEF